MSELDDFRFLAEIDQRHSRLRHATDSALQRLEKIDVQHDSQGKPLVAVGLIEETCPIDPTATFRIKYWIGDTTRRSLIAALTKSSLAVIREMEGRGEAKIWGACPKDAAHLVGFLDRVVAVGLCRRVDADTADLENDHPYLHSFFYIAERAQAEEFMRR